jgi:hypothetical protein
MIQEFLAWLKMPFESGMSATRWFAWVGLILAAIAIWSMVLRLLEDAA